MGGAGRSLVEVAPGVHVATADTFTTTSTVVVAPDGASLVVDPALSPAELRALAATMSDRGWRPVAGFSTHPHWDHLLWHPDLGDVPRWATAEAARYAADNEADLRAEAARDVPGAAPALEGVVALPPGTPELPWPGPRAEIVPHHAHAAGHAALVVGPVLLAGDMLSDVEVPLLDVESPDPLADHHDGLDLLATLLQRAGTAVVVPGHGHVTDRRGALHRLDADRRYLDVLDAGRHVDAADDPRLADAWVRAQHERQMRLLQDR